MYVLVFDLMVVTPQGYVTASHIIWSFYSKKKFLYLLMKCFKSLSDLCSSIEKGETRTPSCHTRAVIKVQSYAEEEQADAFGELRIRMSIFPGLGFIMY